LLHQRTSLATKFRVLERALYSREAKRQIEQLIQDTKPDIAHVHEIADEISPSILHAIKQAGIPMVQTLHDYKLLCPNTSFVSRGEVCERCKGDRYFHVVLRECKRDSLAASLIACWEAYFHKLLRIYEGTVDLFIAPSRFLQHKLAEHGFDARVEHLPNLVDVDSFQPCYETSDYFVYFGRLVGVKGVETLFEAMRSVHPSLRLYIIGEGELEKPLRAYTQRYNLSNIVFLGHLDTQDLVPIIQRATFTVIPSECYENYPMAVLESFACGTPVIGTNIGGIPEIIQDGRNGLLFEPGDERQLADRIQFLLDNPQQAIEMGRNGRQQVETVNHPQRHYEQLVEIYQQLLA
jgi:glycosyltransferase involved in cell wall biosynthesis